MKGVIRRFNKWCPETRGGKITKTSLITISTILCGWGLFGIMFLAMQWFHEKFTAGTVANVGFAMFLGILIAIISSVLIHWND